MPEINSAENPRLQEIQELERQLAEKKAAINIENGIDQIEKQAETYQNTFSEPQISAVPTSASATQTDDQKKKEVERDAKTIAAMDESRKVETLVGIALEKGINHSINVAYNLGDPYILDLLHDKLIGELHGKLVEQKKLKEL